MNVCELNPLASVEALVCAAFIIDVHSGMTVVWRVASMMMIYLLMDALIVAAWSRRAMGLVHRNDRWVQNMSIRYTERLAEAGGVASVGRRATPTSVSMIGAAGGLRSDACYD